MSNKHQADILALLDTQISTLGKTLDFKPINLERGSYVAGAISFGSFAVDLATGGGAPAGKWTTVYGPEGSGKSTVAFNIIANANALGVPVVYYDHEAAADPPYMQTLGIKLTDGKGKASPLLRYFQPETGESTYRHMHQILRAMPDFKPEKDGGRPFPSLVFVIDSLDSMLTEAIAENDDNHQMGLQAKMHGLGMRMIKSLLGRKNVAVFATNQLRMKPGVSFGNPEYEPGGQAVKFYPDLKFKMQAVGKVIKERKRDLKFVNVNTIKNKGFVPFRILHNDVKTAPAIAFGMGWERGYDGRAYLTLTNQIDRNDVTMPGFAGTYKHQDLMVLCCSNAFRDAARKQIESGEAFRLYLDREQIAPPSANLEDAGVGGDDVEPTSEDEVEELIEESLPKAKRSKAGLDPDGKIRMKKAARITQDGEVLDDEESEGIITRA